MNQALPKPAQAFVFLPRSLSAGWLIITGLVLHLVLAMSAELSPDEAHYALYGAHLDWSYFDHPPLVGWLQAPFVAAGGTDLLMRIVPMASWLLTVLLMISLCREILVQPAGDRSATDRMDGWVALMLLSSPMLNLLGVALVPDTLLMPMVPAVMSATWRLRTPDAASRLRSWLLLSTLLGCCLLAKYTGIFVVLGALLSLLAFHGVNLWRMRGAWLSAAIIVGMASPIVGWNVQHHWASVVYQSSHAAGDQGWRLGVALRAYALQLALFGLLLPAGLIAQLRATRRPGAHTDIQALAAARVVGLTFGIPILVVFAAIAGRGSSLPHWTACGWVALIPLATAGVGRLRRGLVAGLAIWQAFLLVTILLLILTKGFGSESGAAATSPAGVKSAGTHVNPVTDVVGWQAAAEHGEGLAEQRRARGLVVLNWSLASRMAWYARPMPVFVAPEHTDQFSLWFGALQPKDSMVVVDWSQMPLPVPIGPGGFAKCTPIGQLPTVANGRQLAHFNYLYCEDWRSQQAAAAPR